MPTASAIKARWIGAAAPRGPRRCRVHSLFRAAIYLEIEGCDYLCFLARTSGAGLPCAIALSDGAASHCLLDFLDWPLEVGATGFIDEDALVLGGGDPFCSVMLRGAERGGREPLPAVRRLGIAFRASVDELSRAQARLGCDLGIGSLLAGESPSTAMGRALASSARKLGDAASAGGDVVHAVGALIGLGAGLTPSGDDFLCGFLCAAGCIAAEPRGAADSPAADPRRAQAWAIGRAVEDGAAATGAISASFLKCAARGFFPRDLNMAAASIAADDRFAAAASIGSLCDMGHSSGADTATGFLCGLAKLMPSEGRDHAAEI